MIELRVEQSQHPRQKHPKSNNNKRRHKSWREGRGREGWEEIGREGCRHGALAQSFLYPNFPHFLRQMSKPGTMSVVL